MATADSARTAALAILVVLCATYSVQAMNAEASANNYCPIIDSIGLTTEGADAPVIIPPLKYTNNLGSAWKTFKKTFTADKYMYCILYPEPKGWEVLLGSMRHHSVAIKNEHAAWIIHLTPLDTTYVDKQLGHEYAKQIVWDPWCQNGKQQVWHVEVKQVKAISCRHAGTTYTLSRKDKDFIQSGYYGIKFTTKQLDWVKLLTFAKDLVSYNLLSRNCKNVAYHLMDMLYDDKKPDFSDFFLDLAEKKETEKKGAKMDPRIARMLEEEKQQLEQAKRLEQQQQLLRRKKHEQQHAGKKPEQQAEKKETTTHTTTTPQHLA